MFEQLDYARSGTPATETIVIPAGPIMRASDEPFPHNMEPQLRKLHMPTRLVCGVVTLDREYTICQEGDVLTPDQAQLLKLFYKAMANFKIDILCHWEEGVFVDLQGETLDR